MGFVFFHKLSRLFSRLRCDQIAFIGKNRTEKRSASMIIRTDLQAKAALQLVDHVRKANAVQFVPLQIDARRTRMKAERAIEKLQEDALQGSKSTKGGPTAENDYVLREALAILSDYIDLRGGPDEPVNVEGDLRSRIFKIFGSMQ